MSAGLLRKWRRETMPELAGSGERVWRILVNRRRSKTEAVRAGGVESAGEAAEVKADAEQAGQLAECGQGMRPAKLLASEGQAAEGHPEAPASQLPLDGLTGAGTGQWRRVVRHQGKRGIRWTCRSVHFVQKRPPAFHPAAVLVSFPGFAIHDRRVKEGGGEPGEVAVATDRAPEGNQGLRQIV